MRQMKDSGIEWIGEIPTEWEVKNLKYAIERNDGGIWGDEPTGNNDIIVLRSTEQTIDGEWNIDSPAIRNLQFFKIEDMLLKEKDIVITKSSGSALHIGKATFVTKKIESMKCTFSNFMQRVRVNKNIIPRLLWYWMNSKLVREQFLYAKNSTSGLGNITAKDIDNLLIAFPPIPEQQRIADYLDAQCARIDETMELVRQSKEKLRAYKLSLITEAVTKGLDPDVPMKDSGIPWIGEIPAGWQCLQLKRVAANVKTGSTPKGAEEKYYAENGIKWFTPSDFTTFPYINDSTKKLSELGACEVKIFPQNSVLLIGIGATMGKVSLSNSICSANQQINSIQCNKKLSPLFLTFYLSTITDYLFKCGKFTTLPILNQEETKNIYIPLPPLPEQQRIAAYLDEKCARIDALLAEKDELLDKLAEYRKSLIFECVTGKREVAA